MNTTEVGIIAAACHLPSNRRTVDDLFREEGVKAGGDTLTRLGIDRVPLRNGESGSFMALAASQEALQRAGIDAAQLDFIIDYTILPQDYLVPAWNMSNRLQHELGAKKAFTVGFSGGGASNFLVSLSSGVAMLQANDNFKAGLLVGSEVTIPGSRVVNPSDPVTVLGDGASAVILQKGATTGVVLSTELRSDGANHDVYYIPGGALAHDQPEMYRMQLDKTRYDSSAKFEAVRDVATQAMQRAGVTADSISFALYPNISCDDQARFQEMFNFKPEQMCVTNRAENGHLHGTDFVLNYLSMLESGNRSGQHVVAASHGMGYLAGASVIRC